MISENPALAALRQATQQVHKELEQGLHIASANAGRRAYLDYAAALWGWLSRFEQDLWSGAWPAEMQAEKRIGKSGWLLQDLRHGGLSDAAINALPTSGYQPDLHSVAARFGTAYVIEGAQLGAQVLRKRLGPALSPWTPRWLEGYGEHTALNWRTFVGCMQGALDSDASRAAAANSAQEAFSSLATWLRIRSVA